MSTRSAVGHMLGSFGHDDALQTPNESHRSGERNPIERISFLTQRFVLLPGIGTHDASRNFFANDTRVCVI